ncbi:hypothetical protein [Paraburkholderia haematera]|jgi:hypothetical protein|uniref:Uncharacterized protein n=1 Tax=Paraburkholderia haematera TaxID=2793077 RepID=A0ABM8SW81_9BURK|nr:hypothetical protein [Paraburkholderia haematera]CAE6837783.1 hypothetical protein R69888_06852 [Paraburkholderia haematera]
MTTLRKIEDFRAVERNLGYANESNPHRLTIAELTPVALTWQSSGVPYSIHNFAGVIGRLLDDASGIAVVEAPYDLSTNQAYIVNADGSLRAQIPAQIGAERVTFYDVIETKDAVAFLAAAPGRDVRIEVRQADGVVMQVAESR